MACGVIFVGLVLVVMDYFATKLERSVGRLRSPPKGLKSDRFDASTDENRKIGSDAGGFFGAQNHRMRRGGVWVIGGGFAALIILLLAPSFGEFPSQDFVLKVGNFVAKRTSVPWGQISVIAAVGFTAIAVFLFWAGVEHWKVRGNPTRAVLCFILGAGILIEGIFQWQ